MLTENGSRSEQFICKLGLRVPYCKGFHPFQPLGDPGPPGTLTSSSSHSCQWHAEMKWPPRRPITLTSNSVKPGRTIEISMALCKTAVTLLLKQWSYGSLALSHRFDNAKRAVLVVPGPVLNIYVLDVSPKHYTYIYNIYIYICMFTCSTLKRK